MRTTTNNPDQTGFYSTHPSIAPEIRDRIVRSEVEGGVRLRALAEGDRVVVKTANRIYQIEIRGGRTWISGHPRFCPQPVAVSVRGSTWGGSMLKPDYLGLGMHMEFQHPDHATVVTSRIESVSVS